MDQVNKFITIRTNLAKSVNIERDQTDQQALNTYILTNSANQSINRMIDACASKNNSNKAFSIIGPYGSGKSSFAIYLSHLLSANNQAIKKLSTPLRKSIKSHLKNSQGYCNVFLSGTPEPLIQSFLHALKFSIPPYYQQLGIDSDVPVKAINILLTADKISLQKVINLVRKIRLEVQQAGGKGLLIIIDELGKFLEYSARHESDDIFLLQVLAEESYKTSNANILLFVLLHQSFEQYGKNLSNTLKNEWTKIQGRYQTLSFVDSITESLFIIAQTFKQNLPVASKQKIITRIESITNKLKKQQLLPHSLDETKANDLFVKCYPLHPLTLLLLPVLSQKIAQNERTLFNYLGSSESFALMVSMQDLILGDFIYPCDIYDYFINGEYSSNDFQTTRTLSEAHNALDRATDVTKSEVKLLKTIALFNIANSSMLASKTVLALSNKNYSKDIKQLLNKSIITYRKFNGEYRIWQGSDFDLNEAIIEHKSQLTTFDIAEYINEQQIFLPFVAQRYSIEKHSLFYFKPVFIYANQYQKTSHKDDKPRIIFCLNYNKQDKETFQNKIINYFDKQDICVLIGNSNNILMATIYCIALENIAKQNNIIEQDPVIHREFTQYLLDAKQKEQQQFHKILENPGQCKWYNQKKQKICKNKRVVQGFFSDILENIYPDTPIIKNEIINQNNLSGQGNAGRKKLLLHLLNHHDKKDLGIEKCPAEKSMYIAILKDSGIHKKTVKKWQIQPPKDKKFLKIWQEVQQFFDQSEDQVRNLSKLDKKLTAPPFGIKQAVLPIFYIANYLFNKDEIAVYEDRIYIPYFTDEHLERFLKRPDTFTFQQFKIKGLNQTLMREYEQNLLDKKPKNAQAIFGAISVFIKELSPYTKQTQNISIIAQNIRDAFKNNKSPQDLLFKKLPKACGFDNKKSDGFGAILKGGLKEIKQAYTKMVNQQIGILAEKLNIKRLEKNKGQIKTTLIEYGQRLQAYSIDKETTKFINIISQNYGNTDHYFERILTTMIDKHPKEWTDIDNDFVKQKLSEHMKLIINLNKIHAYHLKDELIDPQEMVIFTSTESLTDKAKIRLVNKILNNITTKEKVKND